MRIHVILAACAAAFLATGACARAQERSETEFKLKEKPPRYLGTRQFTASADYEYSWITQGGRRGQWRLLTQRVGYSFDNGLSPYCEVDSWERFHDHNQMVNAGAYYRFPDRSYLHSEVGFGNDISYLPKFQTLQEYERPLVKNCSWQIGYRYLHYPVNDVYIAYPGLVYYFGDNYLGAFYSVSFTHSRGAAQSGSLKGSVALHKRVNLWLGTAVGERLYDIQELKAAQQYGYVVFSGFDVRLYKELRLRLGFSYSRERPSFIKRSIDYGLSLKF